MNGDESEKRYKTLINGLFFFQLFIVSLFGITLIMILLIWDTFTQIIDKFDMKNLPTYFDFFLMSPTNNALIIIGIVSAFIIFSYFMHNLYLNSLSMFLFPGHQINSGSNDENKYFFAFLPNANIILTSTTFFIIFGYLLMHKENFDYVAIYMVNISVKWIEIFILVYSYCLALIAAPLINRVMQVIKDYNAEVLFNKYLKDQTNIWDYKRNLNRQIYGTIWITYLLIFLILILGYIAKFNILSLLFIEFSLVYSFMALSIIKEAPKRKLSIKTDTKEYNQIYIISETKDEMMILSPESKIFRLPKKDIQLIENYNDS